MSKFMCVQSIPFPCLAKSKVFNEKGRHHIQSRSALSKVLKVGVSPVFWSTGTTIIPQAPVIVKSAVLPTTWTLVCPMTRMTVGSSNLAALSVLSSSAKNVVVAPELVLVCAFHDVTDPFHTFFSLLTLRLICQQSKCTLKTGRVRLPYRL